MCIQLHLQATFAWEPRVCHRRLRNIQVPVYSQCVPRAFGPSTSAAIMFIGVHVCMCTCVRERGARVCMPQSYWHTPLCHSFSCLHLKLVLCLTGRRTVERVAQVAVREMIYARVHTRCTEGACGGDGTARTTHMSDQHRGNGAWGAYMYTRGRTRLDEQLVLL